MNDLRFAFRQLRKSPGFTAIAVLTLALGIGANSAIFSVVNAVLLRPLPYPQADRLVYLNEVINGTNTAIALPNYLDWQRDSTSFEHLALTRLESLNLSDVAGREPERISVSLATANFFDAIGLRPQLGRTFTADEDKPGAPPLAVISDRLWDRAFHRDPQIVGRAITLHGRPVTVIGVMPREMDSPRGADIWLSLMRRSAVPAWQNRANHPMFYAWGRLKEGVTIEQGARRDHRHRGAAREAPSGDECRCRRCRSAVARKSPRELPHEPGVAPRRCRPRVTHRVCEPRESSRGARGRSSARVRGARGARCRSWPDHPAIAARELRDFGNRRRTRHDLRDLGTRRPCGVRSGWRAAFR
jgi:hypothetical protein